MRGAHCSVRPKLHQYYSAFCMTKLHSPKSQCSLFNSCKLRWYPQLKLTQRNRNWAGFHVLSFFTPLSCLLSVKIKKNCVVWWLVSTAKEAAFPSQQVECICWYCLSNCCATEGGVLPFPSAEFLVVVRIVSMMYLETLEEATPNHQGRTKWHPIIFLSISNFIMVSHHILDLHIFDKSQHETTLRY